MEFGDTIYKRRGIKSVNSDQVEVKIEWLSGDKLTESGLQLTSNGTYAIAYNNGQAIYAVRLHLNAYDIQNRSNNIDKIWAIDAMDLFKIEH